MASSSRRGRPALPASEKKGSRCSVPGCDIRPGPGVMFHRLPPVKSPRRLLWLSACCISNAEERGELRVCSNHFDLATDYHPSSKLGQSPLRRQAVPTRNLPAAEAVLADVAQQETVVVEVETDEGGDINYADDWDGLVIEVDDDDVQEAAAGDEAAAAPMDASSGTEEEEENNSNEDAATGKEEENNSNEGAATGNDAETRDNSSAMDVEVEEAADGIMQLAADTLGSQKSVSTDATTNTEPCQDAHDSTFEVSSADSSNDSEEEVADCNSKDEIIARQAQLIAQLKAKYKNQRVSPQSVAIHALWQGY